MSPDQLKKLLLLNQIKTAMSRFLDTIRDYEHECGSAIYLDERHSEEFVSCFVQSEDGNIIRDIINNTIK